MKWITDSIRWRIFVYYTALTATAIVLLVSAHMLGEIRHQEQLFSSRLQARLLRVLPFIFPPRDQLGDKVGASLDERQLATFHKELEEIQAAGIFVVAKDTGGNTVFQSQNFPSDLTAIEPSASDEPFTYFTEGEYFLVQMISPKRDRVYMGISRVHLRRQAGEAFWPAFYFGIATLALTASFGYAIIRHGLRPIDLISQTALRISNGDLSERIEVAGQSSELGTLANVLNETFARLQEALMRQVRFTADASHELRTPVAAILADCQFALKRPRPVERYLETIGLCQESARHMKSLIERLGLLARLDGQDTLLDREWIDLADLARYAVGVVTPLAAESRVVLEPSLESVKINTDRLRMGQVILNLLNNAIKYNRPGGTVSLKAGPEGKDFAFVEVTDTGIGIPADKVEKVFDRFFRVDPSRNKKTGGSGLGLAICKAVVEAQGGTISVSSEEGRGSTFRFVIPRGESSPQAKATSPPQKFI